MEVLLVLQILIVIALVGVILLQKSSSDGFTGGGGGSPGSFMTGRASANALTKITSILAAAFLLNSLVLAYMAAHIERAENVLDEAISETEGETEGAATENGETSSPLNNLQVPVDGAEDSAETIKGAVKDSVNKASKEVETAPAAIPTTVPVAD